MTIAAQKWYDRPTLAAIGLAVGAVVALVWTEINTPSYLALTGDAWHHVSVHSVAVNGLLTVFFLGIGIEIARERRHGALRDLANSLAPIAAALGGMAGTALLTVLVGVSTHSAVITKSWGVPMATDIAFVVGAMAIAGPSIPRELRIFLLALAVVDDAGSLAVLTVTGAAHPRVAGVFASVVVIGALPFLRRLAGRWQWLVALVALWLALSWAGLEPALAGAIIGFAVPTSTTTLRLERWCTRWSALVALPVFALSACGVDWRSLTTHSVPIVSTMITVRIIGKIAGVGGTLWLISRLRNSRLTTYSPRQMLGAGALCAMGFTVPLLFAQVDFGRESDTYGALTVGLLAATVVGGIIGLALLWRRD